VRSHARCMLVAEPPFTRSFVEGGLSTRSLPVTRFPGQGDVPTTSAIRAMHGHLPRAHRFLVCGSERGRLFTAFAFGRPLSGTARANEPSDDVSPKRLACPDRPTRAKDRTSFDGRGPSSNRAAHLLVMRALR